MNSSLISLEISVIALGLVLMLADLFVPAERRRFIGYAAIAALGTLLLINLSGDGSCAQLGTAFSGSYVNDGLSLFFKRFFVIAAILVLFIAAEFSDRLAEGSIAEYYSLIVFALAGMLFAALPGGRLVMPAAALLYLVPWVSEKPSPQLRLYPYLRVLMSVWEMM